jgi:hypothetical protein
MPYTISHTALVLPIARLLARWHVLAAVLIGSMVPDFGVLSPWRLERVETHSFAALFSFCLPVGLLTYWVFQFLIKPAMAEILPDGPYSRWQAYAAPEPVRSLRQWLLAACGILLGALSHLIVDGFTHDGGRGVRLFPALDEPLFDVGHRHIMATRLMQDGGSLVGLIVVFVIVLLGWRRAARSAVPERLLSRAERHGWVGVYALVTLLFYAVFYFYARDIDDPGLHRIAAFIYDSAVAMLRGLAAAVLGVSVLLSLRLKMRR